MARLILKALHRAVFEICPPKQDGYIVTNNHVIEHVTDIKVAFSDQEELTAKVIGRDPKMDVALIKVEAGKELPVVALGNSDQERAGNWGRLAIRSAWAIR